MNRLSTTISSLIKTLSDKQRLLVQQLANRQTSTQHDAIVSRARTEFHKLMELHEDMELRSKSMTLVPVTREYGRELLKEYEKILNTVQVRAKYYITETVVYLLYCTCSGVET